VQERFDGRSVAEHDRIALLGLDETDVADRLVRAMTTHILHGHFHADPHPGNVLVLDDGSLGLIDFGSTGRLDPSERGALLQIARAVLQGDSAALREGIEQVTEIGPDVPQDRLERTLAHFVAENRSSGVQAFNRLLPLLDRFDIRLPRELTMLFRALVLLEGTARTISPGYSLAEGMTRALGNGGPLAHAGTLRQQLVQELLDDAPRLRRLPAQIDRIATLATRGELQIRLALFSSRRDSQVITTLVNRVVLGFVAGAAAVGSALLLLAGRNAGASAGASLTTVFGFLGLALATVLVLRVVAAIVREGYN
jgi:ubiquinone biosynthesis protein